MELAADRLDEFEAEWGARYSAIVQSWRRNWDKLVPFFAFAPEVRRIIYTTNAIESLNMTLRRAIKTRGSFPTDEAAVKLLFLASRNAAKGWRRSAREWRTALNHFAIMFGNRFQPSAR